MKFDVVFKQFKLTILILVLSESYVYKENTGC